MCGYCTEEMMIQEFVNARLIRSQINMDDLFLPQYLQDYENFDWIIKNKSFSAQYLPDVSGKLVDILFCRLYDHFLFHGHDGDLFDYLLVTIGVEKADQFFTARHHCHEQVFPDPMLDILANPDLYQDKQIWDNFIENNATLTSITAECLRRYIDWWLLGKGRAKDQDGLRRLEETGIYDPIIDTPQKEWDKCNSMFPSLYFTLAFLSRTQPRSEIIKTIALTGPDGTPDLLGNDLWLQRRAFLACVKAYGIDFIVANIHLIRPPLICHAMLNIDFPPDEFERLHLAVLFERERTGENEEYEGILQLGKKILREYDKRS
jgi:hypothetical protein